MRIPRTATDRLLIRDFTAADTDARRTLISAAFNTPLTAAENADWMAWTMLGYGQYAALYQPAYGERAVALREGGALIGVVGLVPSLIPWAVLPECRAPQEPPHTFTTPEFGMFWAIDAAHRGQGYAVEAAGVIVEYAFTTLRARRIVATTEHDNHASQRVMQKLGMTVYHNPGGDPPWFEAVGVLDNPASLTFLKVD